MTVRHDVATFVEEYGTSNKKGRIICTCGWVSEPVWLEDVTVTFHLHAHGRI